MFPPDTGDSIIFFSDRAGESDLWLVDPSSGEVGRITRYVGSDYEPDWSPDRSIVVFSSDRENAAADLFLLTVTDGVMTPLTDTPDTVDDYSNFAPDGASVVFQRSFVDETPTTAEIFVIDVATGEERRVTDNAFWDSTPSFAPDGESIIFESNRTGVFELWTTRLDGSRSTQLTESPTGTVNSEARFSPDGAWIIYATVAPGGDGDLALINVATNESTLLTQGDENDGHGEFSPDGETITFHRDGDIFLMDADGGNLRQLTSGPAEDLDPHWH